MFNSQTLNITVFHELSSMYLQIYKINDVIKNHLASGNYKYKFIEWVLFETKLSSTLNYVFHFNE